MKISRPSRAFIFTVFVGAVWGLIELINVDGTPESWLLLKLFHPGAKYYELNTSLEVGGLSVSFTRTIECKSKFVRSDRAGGLGYSAAWYPSRYLVSEALADGSGVMLVVPRACNMDGPPPSDFVPLVLWVKNTENPDELEAYIDSEQLLNGGLRVKLLRFGMALTTDNVAAPIPAEDFADHLNVFGPDPSPAGTRVQYRAMAAIDLERLPEGRDFGGEAHPQDGSKLHITPLAINDLSQAANELIIATSDRLSGAYNTSLPPDLMRRNERLASLMASLSAFQPTDGKSLLFNPTPSGVLHFIRSDLIWCDRVGEICITAADATAVINDNLLQHYLLLEGRRLVQFHICETLVLH